MEAIHTPSFLKTAVKENNMVLSKENREITALSGQSGFGSAKPDFECEIRSADVLDGSSLQLRGLLEVQGTYTENLKLNGSAYSLIDQITIEYNGQPILNITQDADYIAHMNRVLHSSVTQFNNDDVFALASVNVNTADALSFVLDLSKYGSSLKYFLVTSPVASMKVRIHFQKDLARLFNGPADDAGKNVTGYVINNLRLCGDFVTMQSSAQSSLIKHLQTSAGIKMVTHSFVPERTQFLPGATNHRMQGSFQYRNLISAYYLPVPTSIQAADKNNGVNKTDIIRNVTFVNSEYPQEMRVRMSGSNFVNQNSTSGCTNKMEHLTSVMKAAMRTPVENNIGSQLCEQYSANSYQVTGVSFVRGNDNLVDITNSGANGFASRGLLETEFRTASAQANKTLLTIGVITTTISVENGQVSVLR